MLQTVQKISPYWVVLAWKNGGLKYKLLPHSWDDYDFIWDCLERIKHDHTAPRKLVLHEARRTSKTYKLCTVGLELCLRKVRARVRYGASTAKSVRNFIRPIIDDLIGDAPPEYKPVWMTFDGCYRFPNGSEFHVVGVNGGHENDIRGTGTDLYIMDEAGFTDNLEYVVDSVIMPQVISENGFCIIASSSPESPAHEFVGYIEEAKQRDMLRTATIFDAHYTPEQIASFCEEAGGEKSTFWRREYLNEIIVDESRAIVPEWDNRYIGEPVKDEFTQYYHRYTCMDLGVINDKTAVLAGHYNFREARLYVEDLFTIKGPALDTELLKEEITKLEDRTYKGIKPYRRVSDNDNPMLIQDLGHLHGMHFNPTNKDELHAMVNELRLWVKSGRVRVSSKCKELIGCLQTGIWDKQRKKFDRSKTYGHYDCLAALVYMVRNIDQNSNPIPKDHNYTIDTFTTDTDDRSNAAKEISKLFKVVK